MSTNRVPEPLLPTYGLSLKERVMSIMSERDEDSGSPKAETYPPSTGTNPISDRPDGSTQMMLGWFFLIIACVCAGAYLFVENPLIRVCFAAGAGSFFSLFITLWSVGYIVNAISYLPAKNGG